MEINIVTDNQKDTWNSFIIENNGSFLQSFEWGQFQEKSGNKVLRIQAKDGSKVQAQALVIKHKLKFGLKSYLYIPYGPCFKDNTVADEFFQEIKKIAKKEHSIFVKVEPYSDINVPGIITEPLQPKKTLLLDLKQQTDEMLKGLHKDTRYSIRTAEKNGVIVEFEDKYNPEFYRLLLQITNKANFRAHEEVHYKRFFDVANETFKLKMCLAKHENKVISASIMIMFANRATYLHAASDKSFSALQAPSFLIWEQMKLAKNNFCDVFDLWGIDDEKWPGVTKFKKSFGGREMEYSESKNIVLKKGLYATYSFIKRIRP